MQFLKEETMKTLRIAGLLVFALTGFAIADEAKSAPKNIPDFDVQGISMTECQCTAYACPCRSNGHPDHGSCDAADFTYIKHGHYGKVDMSGFKAVLIGDLIDPDASKVQGTAYFDKGRTEFLTPTISSEPRLERANHPQERNGALQRVRAVACAHSA
jgi:hypothetical protein